MTPFKVHTEYSPARDQPEAIDKLTASIVYIIKICEG